MDKFINAFYHIDDYDPSRDDAKDAEVIPSIVSSVSKLFMNDDDVVKIIYSFAQNCGALPDDTKIASTPDSPQELKRVVDALNRKFPTFAGFNDEESAFEFVRSRYDQYGQEVDAYVQRLADVVDQSSQEAAVASSGAASE